MVWSALAQECFEADMRERRIREFLTPCCGESTRRTKDGRRRCFLCHEEYETKAFIQRGIAAQTTQNPNGGDE